MLIKLFTVSKILLYVLRCLSGNEDLVQLRENENSERNETTLGDGKGKMCCNFFIFCVGDRERR